MCLPENERTERRDASDAPQTADKIHNHKNSNQSKKIGWNFCLLRQPQLQMAVTHVYVRPPYLQSCFLVLWAFSAICICFPIYHIYSGRFTLMRSSLPSGEAALILPRWFSTTAFAMDSPTP